MDERACPCCGVNKCTPELIKAWSCLKAKYPKLVATSWYRCDLHQAHLRQAWVRGKIEYALTHPGQVYHEPEPALHSQHSTGNAVDMLVTNADQPAVIEVAKLCGFNGFGQGNGILHADRRVAPARWRY